MDKTQLTYLDFELEIGLGYGRDYPVAVIRSPAGEARETMRFPFDELVLENRLLALQNALLRSGSISRQVLLPEEQTVQDFGQDLFNALITGEVRSRYDVSLERAWQAGRGIRLKLRIKPPELAALPWEFLYDPRQADYVCLSCNTPVVRYLELPRPIPPLSVTPPLRILGMIASPADLPSLDVTREQQRVERALEELRVQGLVDLHWLSGQTWRHLQRAMRRGPWHIFHFIGHGSFDRVTEEGFIALADREGNTCRLSATHLGRLLADHHSLRLALLNACEGARGSQRDVFSSTASILVRRGIPAVLAMQYEITDRAAIEVARVFYEALAEGLSVDTAIAEARKAVSLAVSNTLEWGTPVLHMRSSDGVLFDISELPVTDVSAESLSKADGSQPATVEPDVAGERSPMPFKHAVSEDVNVPETVFVPSGPFLMGSTEDNVRARNNEQPQRRLELDAFRIGRYPVTNAEYNCFIQAGGYERLAYWTKAGWDWREAEGITQPRYWEDPRWNQLDHPVVGVTWHEALAYCRWLSEISCQQFCLPSEAEWEKAARGEDGREWPWGNEFDWQKANTAENNLKRTTRVGLYSPGGDSPCGAADMAGNVWEWTRSLWGRYSDKPEFKYPYKPKNGCEALEAGDSVLRVLRGGAFNSNQYDVRCASRGRYTPDHTDDIGSCGFRIARL